MRITSAAVLLRSPVYVCMYLPCVSSLNTHFDLYISKAIHPVAKF